MLNKSLFATARRISLLAIAIAVAIVAVSSWSLAADDAKADKKEEKKASDLPLKKIVLFNSGVGFYEHSGDITGNAHVDLKFKVDDVNDLLKSMVLQDLGGGRISTINYDSKDPITRTLKTFAIDLTTNPTLADLLKQIRGEQIQIEAPTAITGTIVGIEKRKVRVGKDEVIEQDFITLLTDEGLRSINLESVMRIKLSDERLNKELTQALKTLAMGHATDKKTVSLNFLGEGKRPVRVGYIQESPIWKTSYRLVLDDKEKPFLQGWAIVENTTEEDWNDVNLTLVSGRPISFVMDLYQPLYLRRPVVQPELHASLTSQTYGQDMADKAGEFADAKERFELGEPASGEKDKKSGFGGQGKGYAIAKPVYESRDGSKVNAELESMGASARYYQQFNSNGRDRLKLAAGVQSAAQGGDVGELFQYTIDTPVKLNRQQSAMLPIVNEKVEGEKLSIYNQRVHAKHPLNGLKLKNATKLHLMQGPITVFDGNVYAGDARIEDLPPGSERLVSYAMDLDTEVAPETKQHPEQLVSVKLIKGVLHTSRKYTREQNYTIKNSGDREKKVLIEYPLESQWKLITPQEPAEKTRDLYRFAVQAKPGKAETLAVKEELMMDQQIAVSNINDQMILTYINSKVISDETKKALQEVIARKQEIQQLAQQQGNKQQQIQAIDQEQNRIRQNMNQLDRNSELYNRYVKKLGEQETKVDTLREEFKKFQSKQQSEQKSLDDFLINFAEEK